MPYGDTVAVKVVFVEGAVRDYAAYIGPSHWPDTKVQREGEKLSETHAWNILSAAADYAGLPTANFRQLEYRR